MALDTINHQEFEKRLEAANQRLRQELADTQERVQRLDALIARKEAFAHKRDTILAEIEQEEAEIAADERELRPRRAARRVKTPV